MAYDYKNALKEFNIDFKNASLISSSANNQIRLIYNIDDKFILEAEETDAVNENKFISITKLIDRYNEYGLLCPKYIKSVDSKYVYNDGQYSTTVREVVDAKTLADSKDVNYLNILNEIYEYLGKYSSKYKNVDIYPFRTTNSIIDLSPLDSDIDEKQVHLNALCEILKKAGFNDLAIKLSKFNERIRTELKGIYKKLPRCNYQGNLNNKSILVKDNHFIGLDDFYFCGSDVIVNYFSNEARTDISEDDFKTLSPTQIYSKIVKAHKDSLAKILKHYDLLPIEKKALELYNKLLYVSGFTYYNVYNNVLRTKERNKLTSLLYMLIV